MSAGRLSSVLLAALAVIANSACATRPARAGSEVQGGSSTAGVAVANVMQIDVIHNRADGGTATIYIEPASGVRHTLGTIAPGERKTFPYRVEAQNRTVTLSAINAVGQTLRSSQTTVPQGAGLFWDLQVNAIRIKR